MSAWTSGQRLHFSTRAFSTQPPRGPGPVHPPFDLSTFHPPTTSPSYPTRSSKNVPPLSRKPRKNRPYYRPMDSSATNRNLFDLMGERKFDPFHAIPTKELQPDDSSVNKSVFRPPPSPTESTNNPRKRPKPIDLNGFLKIRLKELQDVIDGPSVVVNSDNDVRAQWGEDKLKPTSPPTFPLFKNARRMASPPISRIKKEPPPHQKKPLKYSRRIEGILEPSSEPALVDVPALSEHQPIAQLAHGLERVLFNPGVHWLQDPRSRVYNFSPYLQEIPKVNAFAFERLAGFIKSSRDEDLTELARREGRKFAGSTSSLSGMLSHIYFLISQDKVVNTKNLSQYFKGARETFTPGQRMPAAVVMNYNDGVYAIDSYSEVGESDKNILTWMGTLLEKYLTMGPGEFSSYMRSEPPPPQASGTPSKEAYRYSKSKAFVMRSQLDCQDSRLPGTGVFDLKTRACVPIRLDLLNFEEGSGYVINKQHGMLESFEREYYDLIRSAFLKYSFQVRIGNMDGVMVAYHNTARMFGFQYIPLSEIDEAIFGTEPGVGDHIFNRCISLLESIAEEAISCFPQQSVRCTFEKEEGKSALNIWVEPAHWGSEEPRPINQLQVTIQNFSGEDPVKANRAMRDPADWRIQWSIAKLYGVNAQRELDSAKKRQFRAYSFPSGINDYEAMAEFWNNLNFSGQPSPEGALGYSSDKFKPPDSRVQALRDVAVAGRLTTQQWAIEEHGKPKVVLGEPIGATQVIRDGDDLIMASSSASKTAEGSLDITPIEDLSAR